MQLLYQYLLHRLHGFDFPFKAEMYEKEQIFIPAGFDSATLIAELFKGEHKLFEELVPEDRRVALAKDPFICDEWQEVLTRLKDADPNAVQGTHTKQFFEGLLARKSMRAPDAEMLRRNAEQEIEAATGKQPAKTAAADGSSR